MARITHQPNNRKDHTMTIIDGGQDVYTEDDLGHDDEPEQTPEQIAVAEAEARAKAERRAERVATYVADLRALADYLETHPDIVPDHGGVEILRPCDGPEALAAGLKALGAAEKHATDYTIGAIRRFGVHQVNVYSLRGAVCEQVETGEVKTVTTTAAPSAPVPEGARNVRTVTQVVYEIDEPVTEYVCPPSLLNPGQPAGE